MQNTNIYLFIYPIWYIKMKDYVKGEFFFEILKLRTFDSHWTVEIVSFRLNIESIIEISVKSVKDSTSTWVWSYTGWDYKKKSCKLRKPWWFLSFNPFLFFFFPERLHCCYIHFHCSYLYSYYNSSRTLCIKCWDSAFRTEI